MRVDVLYKRLVLGEEQRSLPRYYHTSPQGEEGNEGKLAPALATVQIPGLGGGSTDHKS